MMILDGFLPLERVKMLSGKNIFFMSLSVSYICILYYATYAYVAYY